MTESRFSETHQQNKNKKIWVDADACPVVIREILFKASMRTSTPLTLVANQWINIPANKLFTMITVGKGFDVADNEIVKRVDDGHLVITSDIPLAAEVIEKGAVVLSPRGELLTLANVKARLTMRNFMEDLRTSGVNIGGPSAMSQSDRRNFSKQLDKYLQ